MANRSIQQKILKMKRRNRFAVFSGASARYAIRIDTGRFRADGSAVEIPVGEISLSKAVISTGRGPDPERMAQYYTGVHAEAYEARTIADIFGVADSRYQQIWNETPKEHKINIVSNSLGRLDLYFTTVPKRWFFVDYDTRTHTIRRSREYGSKAFAMGRLLNKNVSWIETIRLSRK